jgi:hypothetical protein
MDRAIGGQQLPTVCAPVRASASAAFRICWHTRPHPFVSSAWPNRSTFCCEAEIRARSTKPLDTTGETLGTAHRRAPAAHYCPLHPMTPRSSLSNGLSVVLAKRCGPNVSLTEGPVEA